MRRALELACSDDAVRGVNPRVGCVLVRDSRIIAEGHHRGTGSMHAECDALARSTESPRGATAVVTLEPCTHVGRTGPCAEALIDAGVSRVVFALSDPTPEASGGADRLRAAGIEVVHGVLEAEARELNADWIFMKEHGRPHVTLKLAASLDGRVDIDGPERLILTGSQAQEAVHRLRSRVDAIAVGSGTLRADDPRLTVRGVDHGTAPLRVILGTSPVPAGARIHESEGEVLRVVERDPEVALATLAARGIQRLLLEGGPTVAAAYLEAGVVDEVCWFVSPMLVGSGVSALGELGTEVALDVSGVDLMGEDIRVTGVPMASGR